MIEHAANAMPAPSTIIRPPGRYEITPPVATAARLALPSQHVVLFNSSEVQSHGVNDRWEQMQMFAPGEKREICMVCDELNTLIELARTDRGFYTYGPKRGQPFPPHPLKVLGLPPAPSRPIDDREAELSAKAASLAAREAELVARESKLNELTK